MSKKYYKVEEYLFDLPEKWQTRFVVVRDLILASHPEVVERISFNIPFYMLKGFYIYLGIYKKKQLVLAFCDGVLLKDTAGKLRADAGQRVLRHWVLSEKEEPDYELMAAYIEEAAAIRMNKVKKKNGAS